MVQPDLNKINLAVKAARMYYYHGLTTDAIANELHVSRSTISRLLDFARTEGYVSIHVNDAAEIPGQLGPIIMKSFNLQNVHVVAFPNIYNEAEWLKRTAQFTASYLNTLFGSNMILGVAWGTTMTALSNHLIPKTTINSIIVQLNGAGNTQIIDNSSASDTYTRFKLNYNAHFVHFGGPAFFEHKETKQAIWKESSIQRVLDLQNNADVLLYSIGVINAGIPSQVHSSGYLSKLDYLELEKQNVAGDIATVFFRKDGSFDNIPINERSSGPDLSLIKSKYGICVVSGIAKVNGLYAAIKGGLVKDLIIDEPAARELINRYGY